MNMDILVSEIEKPENADVVKHSEILIESIKKYGILNPIVVRKINDKYKIVNGRSRYLIALSLGMETIPCDVTSISDSKITMLTY